MKTPLFIGNKFALGRIVITMGVQEQISVEDCFAAIIRHSNGDWGDVDAEDREINDAAVQGDRIFSVYVFNDLRTLWIITEWDRSVTTVLLPEEY